MLSKILALCISISIIMIPAARADDEAPKYTHIEQGQEAPFAGTLFNPAATARLIAESQFSMSECNLKVEFEVSKCAAEHQLRLDLLQVKYDSLNTRHTLLMDIKQQEIDVYRDMAAKQPNKYNHWWLAGGVVTGIGLTLGVLFASQGIQQ